MLEELVTRAQAGDRAALEAVVAAVQREIYGLALRFLWHPQDAEDATQEILIRLITRLGSFRGDSAFRTWTYRIACNALLSLKRRRMEQVNWTFEAFADDLAQGLSDAAPPETPGVEHALLLEEVKIGCTYGMLLCLDREHRLAYILGEILELDHREAALALDVAPDTFRQRLSRARADIIDFMRAHCGLANPANPCRCRKRVRGAITLGRLDPAQLLFAASAERAKQFPMVLQEVRRLEAARRAAALYRSHGDHEPATDFMAWLRQVIVNEPPYTDN